MALSRCYCHQVSCGPYHSAAVSLDGMLYTWGDGLCGKLGHSDWESYNTPKPVEALYGGEVKWVCCGWWHTAAVVATKSGKGEIPKFSIHSFLERNIKMSPLNFYCFACHFAH